MDPTEKVPEPEPEPEPEPATGHSTAVAFGPDVRPDLLRPGPAGGIYHTRTLTRPSFETRRSIHGRISHENSTDPSRVVQDVEDGDGWRDSHARTKQVFSGTTLLW